MKIVLLSGGSGKRLWPLSNDARSKQFLRLLESPTGKAESMIQRIVRQINEAQLTDDITIATNVSQRDAIQSQLGNQVETVTEPQRRKTFPAIALATAYLALEKKCDREEVIVVMPCDPYTEASYFDTIKRMADAVRRNVANLVLMGIKPSYPSTKFGYILPGVCQEGICSVRRFREKPCRELATEFLEEGAYWNSGVFAFKLGYMMDIVRNYLATDTFAQFRARFEELPAINFDYEVAEKETSLAVLPYEGLWEELGTWGALAKRLKDNTSGNVFLGQHVENVSVINELEIPLLCEGVNNLIVAASPDGIVVCDKEASEQIKDYVTHIHARPMYEERRWGIYKVLNYVKYPDGFEHLTKEIILHPTCHISYQIHQHREEVWTITDGEGYFYHEGMKRKVGRGDVMHIKRGERHAIKAITPLTFIEVQSGAPLVEEDIERLEWPDTEA